MSYGRVYKYRIEPMESYPVVRNCSGCGCKSTYQNTNNFRVNANGTKIDIWLIYQCETCKHTFNLSIYKRVKPDEIHHDLYERYLENNIQLAREYGLNKSLFAVNGAVIDAKSINYKVVAITEINDNVNQEEIDKPGDLIHVENPFGLKV